MRSLFPNDATLRALDLVRHLVASHRWAARVVAAEDGPLRRDFETAGSEALIVDPGPFLAAGSDAAMTPALQALERQIWWTHLDAVAVFDPVCGWGHGPRAPAADPGAVRLLGDGDDDAGSHRPAGGASRAA
ncbi:MAG: hypothetical protein WDM96_02870 [Lacunisphaera sp.]